MRPLLEGGVRVAGRAERGTLPPGSRERSQDGNRRGCSPLDSALVAVYVISARRLDRSLGRRALLPGREAVRQAAWGRRARAGSLTRWKAEALLEPAGV